MKTFERRAVVVVALLTFWQGDAATTWQVLPINGGGYVMNVVACPSDSTRLYCYVDVGGPYRSDDAGRNWRPMHGNFNALDRSRWADCIRTLNVDPRDADSFVFAGGNFTNYPGGIYVSRDGGETYQRTQAANVMGCGPRCPHGTIIDRNPFNPDELIFGDELDGLWRSCDNGATWTNVGLKGRRFTNVRYDRSVRNVVYACAPELPKAGNQGLSGFFKSTDGGMTWYKACASSPYEFVQVAGRVELIGINCPNAEKRTPEAAVTISEDGGCSWRPYGAGLKTESYLAIGVGPDFVLVGDCTDAIYRRAPGDQAWHLVERSTMRLSHPGKENRLARRIIGPMRMEHLCSLVVDRLDADHWFATDWFHIWETHDAGRNWKTATNGMMQLVSWCLAFDPHDSDRMWYGVADMGYFCTTNAGQSYFAPTESAALPYAVTISPSSRTKGLLAAVGGKDWTSVAVSLDGGMTFERQTGSEGRGLPPLKAPHAAYTVAIDPTNDDLLLAVAGPCENGKGGIYRSSDQGKKWHWYSKGLPVGVCLFKESEWTEGLADQIVFSANGDVLLSCQKARLRFRRVRDEDRWEKIDDLPYSRMKMPVADPHVPGRFVIADENEGVCRESLDGGRTFLRMGGLPKDNVFSLAFDARHAGWMALGCRNGFYLSQDGGQTWKLLPDGIKVPSGWTRNVRMDNGKLYILTSGSGVFVRDVRKEMGW